MGLKDATNKVIAELRDSGELAKVLAQYGFDERAIEVATPAAANSPELGSEHLQGGRP